jgi:hypothetical protein
MRVTDVRVVERRYAVPPALIRSVPEELSYAD